MDCFRCATTMKREVYKGILVDKCHSCGGIWLDKGEYDSIKNSIPKDRDTLVKEAKKEIVSEKKRMFSVVGLCPRCQIGRIEQKKILGIEVDSCPECHGFFFDNQELEKVLERDSKRGNKAGFLNFLKKVFSS